MTTLFIAAIWTHQWLWTARVRLGSRWHIDLDSNFPETFSLWQLPLFAKIIIFFWQRQRPTNTAQSMNRCSINLKCIDYVKILFSSNAQHCIEPLKFLWQAKKTWSCMIFFFFFFFLLKIVRTDISHIMQSRSWEWKSIFSTVNCLSVQDKTSHGLFLKYWEKACRSWSLSEVSSSTRPYCYSHSVFSCWRRCHSNQWICFADVYWNQSACVCVRARWVWCLIDRAADLRGFSSTPPMTEWITAAKLLLCFQASHIV